MSPCEEASAVDALRKCLCRSCSCKDALPTLVWWDALCLLQEEANVLPTCERRAPTLKSTVAENEVCWASSPIGLYVPRENPHATKLRKRGSTVVQLCMLLLGSMGQ